MNKKAKIGYDVMGLIGPDDAYHDKSKRFIGKRIKVVGRLRKHPNNWYSGDVHLIEEDITTFFYKFRPRRVLVK